MTPSPALESTVVIERRFHGPPGSGNGGYVCGRLAAFIEGCAKVRLMIPPPLDVPLQVIKKPGVVELHDRDRVVAKAWPSHFELEIPDCPPLAEAQAASRHFGGFRHHPFPTCFVCGPRRKEGEGLRIFPGPTAGRDIVSCPWIADPSLCDRNGQLHPWFVWCALDCPSGWAVQDFEGRPAVLGELSVKITAAVHCGRQLIVSGWETGHDGRKHHTGSALYSASGEVLAIAKATWFEIDPAGL